MSCEVFILSSIPCQSRISSRCSTTAGRLPCWRSCCGRRARASPRLREGSAGGAPTPAGACLSGREAMRAGDPAEPHRRPARGAVGAERLAAAGAAAELGAERRQTLEAAHARIELGLEDAAPDRALPLLQ